MKRALDSCQSVRNCPLQNFHCGMWDGVAGGSPVIMVLLGRRTPVTVTTSSPGGCQVQGRSLHSVTSQRTEPEPQIAAQTCMSFRLSLGRRCWCGLLQKKKLWDDYIETLACWSVPSSRWVEFIGTLDSAGISFDLFYSLKQ